MDYFKVFTVLFLTIVITLQLCHTAAINYQKFNYSSNSGEYKKSSMHTHHHVRSPRSTESENSEIKNEMKPIPSMSIQNGITIIDPKYSQNTTGEYKHEVLFSNMAWRAEQGEYEDHNGVTVFVIRGVFQYYTKEGMYNTTLYIVDEFGYHNIQPPLPVTLDGTGTVDFRPDPSGGCNDAKGQTYCVLDPKLLALLVG